jgi:hypothetical protein
MMSELIHISQGRYKPEIYKRGEHWFCRQGAAVWRWHTWHQALSCALTLASGQIPWMFPLHVGREE